MALADYTDRHQQVAPSPIGIFVDIFMFQWRGRLVEMDDIVVQWNTIIPNARKIKAHRADICLRNKKANTSLTDISCPADGNVGRKHANNLAKYGDFRVKISRVWQCRTQVVSLVLVVLGTTQAGIAGWLDIRG